MIKYLYLNIFLLFSLSISAQLSLDSLNWRSPLDIPIFLSGNFAELRSNHFHSGIDIKTQGKEGFKIHAVQDGYISRIKVSPGGYGKAIYINHMDGHTSVYAHLREYNIQLDRYVRNVQYEKQSYSVDIFPNKWELTVKKGDIIGLSGNSGASAGPHLHFEIRDTKTSRPLNGLFLGYDIKDTIKPRMFYLYAYPQGNTSAINKKRTPTIFTLSKNNGNYILKKSNILYVQGSIGFGLKVNEYLNNSHNRCGVYELNLFVNNELYMQQKYDAFSFSETRYINSLMDYSANINIKRKLYKLYKDPNNNLSIYKHNINRGIVTGLPGETKRIRIQAVDAYGNSSELNYSVRFMGEAEPIFKNTIDIPWEHEFTLDTVGLKVSFPAKSFYDTLHMNFNVNTERLPGTFSPVYSLHEETTPVQKYFKIEIVCDSVDSVLHDKLLLARVVKNDYKAAGGLFIDGKVTAKIRALGKYVVVIDTIKPSIEPLHGIDKLTDITSLNKIQFKIYDEFSGISSYSGTINGNWVLFEWDAKNRLISYTPDAYFPKDGYCELELKVYDGRGNESVFKREYEVFSEADHDFGQ